MDLMPSGTYVIHAEYFQEKARRPSASREITVVLGDNNLLDANIDLNAQVSAK
jgi:hypothetical protein